MPTDEREALLTQIIHNPFLTLSDGEIATLYASTDLPTAAGIWDAIDTFMARITCVVQPARRLGWR